MHASVGQSGMEMKIMILTILFSCSIGMVIPFDSTVNNIESQLTTLKVKHFHRKLDHFHHPHFDSIYGEVLQVQVQQRYKTKCWMPQPFLFPSFWRDRSIPMVVAEGGGRNNGSSDC